jgi:hypothetical protein
VVEGDPIMVDADLGKQPDPHTDRNTSRCVREP